MYKISKRRFLKLSALSSAGLLLPAFSLKKEKIRFGLVTDSHYADRDAVGLRFYRESLGKMGAFVEEMNSQNVDFIIHLGDFKDEDANQDEKDTLKYLSQLENIYAGFNGPRYHCVGNHDVDSITKKQFLNHIENTGIKKSKSYYSFDADGFHFIVLDANFDKDDKDHFYKEGANWQDINIPKNQLNWLNADLDKSDFPTIIFCHHPLFEYTRDQHILYVKNYLETQAILENSKKVMAVFQGHIHEEQHREINDIHYLTQNAMVDYSGMENNSFSIVEIDNKGVQITGYKRVDDRKMKVN